jgi:anti-sigma factor RsiW
MEGVRKVRHPSEEELILYHYGEAGGLPRVVVAEHMAACEPCRARYQKLEAVLVAADGVELPALDEDFEAKVWRRLVPHLDSAPPESFWQRFFAGFRASRFLAPVGAAVGVAVLVVGAFLAGRFWPGRLRPQHQAEAQPVSAQSRERILLVAVGDHLERSQMVLVELVNTSPQKTVDISAERRRAEDLVAPNRLYRLTAERAGEAGVANLLDELERTLIEIAHSPSRLSSPEFEDLRRRVEAQGILFKVRVVDSQVHERERKAIENLARRGS